MEAFNGLFNSFSMQFTDLFQVMYLAVINLIAAVTGQPGFCSSAATCL
jgi:hypothetical protein